ncbi:MAG: LPS-assembly lipoprotein LptE [Halothiobacillus sp.]
MKLLPHAHLMGGRFAVALLAAFTLLSTLGVAGCGYHLRGVTVLDPAYQKVYVQGMNTSDPVYQQLQYLFQNTHSQLVTDPREATATLVIDKNEVQQRAAVVTPQASVQQYELYQRITYHIELPDGRTTSQQSLGRALNYNYDPVGVLASTGNEAQIRQELADSLARLLFYRFNAPLPAPTGTAPAKSTNAVKP